jgi:hypothetical protein
VSHAKSKRPEPPEGFFGLTIWRPADDAAAMAIRAGHARFLEAQGIRTIEQHDQGDVRLCRDGIEAVSDSKADYLERRARKKLNRGENA